jgi:hypothetical protein
MAFNCSDMGEQCCNLVSKRGYPRSLFYMFLLKAENIYGTGNQAQRIDQKRDHMLNTPGQSEVRRKVPELANFAQD